MCWKASRYNRILRLSGDRWALYNGRTGALITLSTSLHERWREVLADTSVEVPIPSSLADEPFMTHLLAGEFVVSAETNELHLIKEAYDRERRNSPFQLTIVPTFACNLSCAYCFVGTKSGSMDDRRQNMLVAFVRDRLETGAPKSMSVDWFGGEPLMALPTIERLSGEFQSMCRRSNVPYTAQVITNGTLLSHNAIGILFDSGVDRLQITLDGVGKANDLRKGIRGDRHSAFTDIVEGINRAIGTFLIRLRINVDKNNMEEAWRLLAFCSDRGWLGPDTGLFPYLARVSPMTEACAKDTRENCCQVDDFNLENERWMARLHGYGVPIAMKGLYQFPEPRAYNCGAVGANGFVITPSGDIHKCGLAIDEPGDAVGRLGKPLDPENPNARAWKEWNPFADPVCASCKFLPSCLGGCPRNRLLARNVEVGENCRYYQVHENRFLATHLELGFAVDNHDD